MIGEILCRGSYHASPGSGVVTLLLQCRDCRMAWNLFLDIIRRKLGVSNDHTREFSSQYDSNVGLLIMPMLKTIPRNASISSRVTGIQFRSWSNTFSVIRLWKFKCVRIDHIKHRISKNWKLRFLRLKYLVPCPYVDTATSESRSELFFKLVFCI